MEKYTIPEVTNDSEWLHLTGQTARSAEIISANNNNNNNNPIENGRNQRHQFNPIKPHQVLIIDIYSSWSGPCSAMEGHLRRMRHQFVATPDCLALAKACCDNIDDLKAFKSDPRPTFLFWARGGPVALLRGANRPLLTRLVEKEVEVEVNDVPRMGVEIDFNSHRVIQCEGELALLDEDEVVHSIGSGSTDMLTSFFQDNKTNTNNSPVRKKSIVPDSSQEQQNETQTDQKAEDGQKDEEETAAAEVEKDTKTKMKEELFNGDVKEQSKVEIAIKVEDTTTKDNESSNSPNNSQEEDETPTTTATNNGFGVKKTKKSKKMETGLLKEILDAKPAKRYGI